MFQFSLAVGRTALVDLASDDVPGIFTVAGISAVASGQGWANLDQAPKDLDKTIFRDLSPTPKP